jgi:DNA polymerase (family 10)
MFAVGIGRGMTNNEIAELLRAVAAAYQAKGKVQNKFKIIAYQRAADAIEHLSSEAKDLWDEKKLEDVAGIGEGISEHLGEIFEGGKSRHFESVMKGLPPAMFELIKVPGIGPKTALRLACELKVSSKNPISDLKKKARVGKIAGLEGFGEDSQKDILRNIDEFERKPEKRMLLPRAMKIADEVCGWMKEGKGVVRVDALGSLRRRASTVGDVDIAVATDKPAESIERFVNYPAKSRMIEKGDKTASILLPGEVQVDLMVTSPESYGALLQHFTGSKHHNIKLRELAMKKRLSLSEYGIGRLGAGSKDKKLKRFASEEGFYRALGLVWIPPELREDSGEIEASLKNKLPKLVELKDVKADLQIHSDFDIETSHDLGESSMEEIVKKASEIGYEYVAMTEHNPSKKGHSSKDIVEILRRKREIVDKLNYSLSRRKTCRVKRVFNSLEVDIMPDGNLPVDEKGLETLDFALVSIHSTFGMDKKRMTERVLRALDHRRVKIFAHPTARKLNFREGVEIDWEKVFEFCLKNDKWLEINAEPMRLDLPDFLVREGVKAGVKFSLGTDSHHKDAMENMKYGVFVARRGWAGKGDIVNTRGLREFEKMLK